MIKIFALTAFLFIGIINRAMSQVYTERSPDKKIELSINTNNAITYSIKYNNSIIVDASEISMLINGNNIGKNAVVSNVSRNKINKELTPLYGKFKNIKDSYNELEINFKQNYTLIFRVYNEGMAYRFLTRYENDIIVDSEVFNITIKDNYSALYPETPKLTSWELPYKTYGVIKDIEDGKRAILPALFSNISTGLKVIVAEADLRDYPGMFIQRSTGCFTGYWAHYPKTTTPYGGEWGMSTSVDSRENYIAKTTGKRNFPWRVVMLCGDDKDLLTNTLIYKLATPQVLTDVSWIKPGKASWEWWHDAINKDAGFPTGMDNRSTKLYKYYIDFAANNNLSYTLIDAGWSNFYNLDKPSDKVNIQELASYAKQKNIGILVWCNATSLMRNIDGDLDVFKAWGLKGIKVDFFDRNDQVIINQLETIAVKAAERQLIVDFHGCPPPTGLQRTYPNIINFEAVRGEESSKWDYSSNPEYHLQLAFIRMLGGSIDYTPGSMRNRSKGSFKPIPEGLPTTQGTRCHELSLFILFDQYLGVLSDSPDAYEKNKDVLGFLSRVPVTYDETRVLQAKLSTYAVVAKKKQNEWYVGATTNWDSSDITIDLSFLSQKQQYKAEIFRDGSDANTNAESYVYETVDVNKNSKLRLTLASGGGAVIRIYPVK